MASTTFAQTTAAVEDAVALAALSTATGRANDASTEAEDAAAAADVAAAAATDAAADALAAAADAEAATAAIPTTLAPFVAAASAAATAADESADDAAQAANDALTHRTAAGVSATAAAGSATSASGSATAASGSATAASGSATAASASATAASGSATTAATGASVATTKAAEANASAAAAADSANAAAQDAIDADAHRAAASAAATAADESADEAAQSANDALTHRTAAGISAGAASASATAASGSATTAGAHLAAVDALVDSVAGLNIPTRIFWADAAFAGSTDGRTFGDAATAIGAALAYVYGYAGEAKVVLGFETGGEAMSLDGTGETRASLLAQGVYLQLASGTDEDVTPQVEALLGFHAWLFAGADLDEETMAMGGLSVNLDALPFPVYEDPDDAPPHGFALWSEVEGKPPILPIDLQADGGVPPNPATLEHGLFKLDPDDADGRVWAVHRGVGGNVAYDLTAPAWAKVTGKPSTFAPSAHTHPWADLTGVPSTFTPSTHTHRQRVFFTDFLATNRNGITRTTSGYECTAPTATASGQTGAGHLLHMGVNAWDASVRCRVGTTTNEAFSLYGGTVAPATDGFRIMIRRDAGGWNLYRIHYVAGAATQTITALSVAPSDNLSWTMAVVNDGAGGLSITITPLGGSPQAFTLTTPGTAIGPYLQPVASGGGLTYYIEGYITIT